MHEGPSHAHGGETDTTNPERLQHANVQGVLHAVFLVCNLVPLVVAFDMITLFVRSMLSVRLCMFFHSL